MSNKIENLLLDLLDEIGIKVGAVPFKTYAKNAQAIRDVVEKLPEKEKLPALEANMIRFFCEQSKDIDAMASSLATFVMRATTTFKATQGEKEAA